MRIAILSDLHANLPFAEAAVRRARRSSCERIVHLGDVIDLGPWPAETLDYLAAEGVEMIRGNHDEYPLLGLTETMRSRLRPEVLVHMEWTAAQLSDRHIDILSGMAATTNSIVDEWRVRFQHFLFAGDRVSEEYLGDSAANAIERFAVEHGEIVCFGHTHQRVWHFEGDRALLNPGATGFNGTEQSLFAVLVIQDASAWVEWHPVDCSLGHVVSELEARGVPGWQDSVNYMFESVAV